MYGARVGELARGAYEHLVTAGLADDLAALPGELVQRLPLDPADADDLLARHIAALTRRALRTLPGTGPDRLARQVAAANAIARAIADLVPRSAGAADLVAASHDLLTAIADAPGTPAPPRFPNRPRTPLSSGALLVNGRGQPGIGVEVQHELASADGVDLLCAFIKWQGLRLIEKQLAELLNRGGRLRVITTTYLGATDQRAVDRLAELGAQIRISYETRTTRLHAKAWQFHRATGAGTAYVGSSNLSRAALVDGLEWNVRLAQLEQPDLIRQFALTFEDYWNDPAFEAYEPDRDRERLATALAAERGPSPGNLPIAVTTLDVRAYGYQREILDELAAQRQVHGRMHGLVVMATGTGKTVLAALDYRRLRKAGTVDSLLFVAHRQEILDQARSTFRHVLGDGTFGESLVGGQRPAQWRHVFASVQSLHQLDLATLDPKTFDMVIVDEFHHAEAASYTRLLSFLQPRVLLGLTATPERADGLDIRRWFDGRYAAELRLWEALERQLLAPLQYFGVHDDVDLSGLHWKRGQGYDPVELSQVYTGHHARVRLILAALRDKLDPHRMRAIGFCVSVGHAEFMAERFTSAGIAAVAVTGQTPAGERAAALRDLRNGELQALFSVDLFNEGVDVPEVDTVLLLRPTDSATVFLQQIGRGLRLADGKACLTVLDFIGGQHANFRFDTRYRALTGTSRRTLIAEAEQGFPTLPAGCHIELDRVAQRIVLANLRSALRLGAAALTAELTQLGDVPLATFLAETGTEPEDLYRSPALGGWTGLRRRAQLDDSPAGRYDAELSSAFGRLLHLDDPDRLAQLIALSNGTTVTGRLARMLHFTLWGKRIPLADGPAGLAAHPARRDELRQLAEVLRDRIHRVTRPLDSTMRVPLRVHARYSRDEACAAFGVNDPWNMREGVKWVEAERADIFFVTLTKTEQHYSPTTMYQDRAITPTLFQWESQSTTSTASPTGQRYVNHRTSGSSVHLFVRETRVADGALGVPPYLYAGPMAYVDHTGDRPMRIRWRLTHELPADVFHAARTIAG